MLRRRTITASQPPSIQIPPIEREKPHHKRLFFRQLQALLAKHYFETVCSGNTHPALDSTAQMDTSGDTTGAITGVFSPFCLPVYDINLKSS